MKEKTNKAFRSIFDDNFLLFIMSMVFIAISYCIFGPLEAFYGNSKELAFDYSDFLMRCVGIAVLGILCTGVLYVCLRVVAEKMHMVRIIYIIVSLVWGIGVLSYIQNMFLNKDLSAIDGGYLNIDKIGNWYYIDIAIWVIVLIACVVIGVMGEKWRIETIIAGFLGALEVFAIVSIIINLENVEKPLTYYLSDKDEFNFSKNQNTVVLLLDAYGNELFEDILSNNHYDFLNDFTYYSNADSGYFYTNPTTCYMMTGVPFELHEKSDGNGWCYGDMYSGEWHTRAWMSDDVKKYYNRLVSQNICLDLYSDGYGYGPIGAYADYFDNAEIAEPIVDKKLATNKMLSMSLYKFVPYNLKRKFQVLNADLYDIVSYADGDKVGVKNADMYAALKENGVTADYDFSMIKWYHLSGTHTPYETSKFGEEDADATIEDCAEGSLFIVGKYLDAMKEVGVYDNATIIVCADHGQITRKDYQPILLVKRPGEKSKQMKVVSAPVSWNDFRATIACSVGIEDYGSYGKPFWEWQDDEQRERSIFLARYDEKYDCEWKKYTYIGTKNDLKKLIDYTEYE